MLRWIFDDVAGSETYTLPINPNEGGTPGVNKSFGYQNTAAPDGKTLMYEGRDEVEKLECKGTILLRDHLLALKTWAKLRRQILITDDLGRQFWVYITNFVPSRKRSAVHPWKHEYTMTLVIFDIVDEVGTVTDVPVPPSYETAVPSGGLFPQS